MSADKPVLAWHFLADDKRLGYGDGRRVRVGVKQVARWPGGYDAPTLCEAGMHGSERVIDALQYAAGPVICRVEIGGRVLRGNDKLCGDWRRVLWMYDASTVLHLFACNEADRVLKWQCATGDEPDARSWNVIRVKRAWVAGKANDDELEAARDAAASFAAWFAAQSAPQTAAWDAARSAARDAAWSEQNKRLTAAIMRGRPR